MKITVKELLKLFDAISDAAVETRDKYQGLLSEIDDLNKVLDDEKPFESPDVRKLQEDLGAALVRNDLDAEEIRVLKARIDVLDDKGETEATVRRISTS